MTTITIFPSLLVQELSQDPENGGVLEEIKKTVDYQDFLLISSEGDEASLEALSSGGNYYLFLTDPLSSAFQQISSLGTVDVELPSPQPALEKTSILSAILVDIKNKLLSETSEIQRNYDFFHNSISSKLIEKQLSCDCLAALSNHFSKKLASTQQQFSSLQLLVSALLGDLDFLSVSLSAEFDRVEQQELSELSPEISLKEYIQRDPEVLLHYQKAKTIIADCSARLRSLEQILSPERQLKPYLSEKNINEKDVTSLIVQKREQLANIRSSVIHIFEDPSIQPENKIPKMLGLENGLRSAESAFQQDAFDSFCSYLDSIIDGQGTEMSRILNDLKGLQDATIQILTTISIIRFHSVSLKQLAVLLQMPASMKQGFAIKKRRSSFLKAIHHLVAAANLAIQESVQKENDLRQRESSPVLKKIWPTITQPLSTPELSLSSSFLPAHAEDQSLPLQEVSCERDSSEKIPGNNSNAIGFEFDLSPWLPKFATGNLPSDLETELDLDAIYSLFQETHLDLNPASSKSEKDLDALKEQCQLLSLREQEVHTKSDLLERLSNQLQADLQHVAQEKNALDSAKEAFQKDNASLAEKLQQAEQNQSLLDNQKEVLEVRQRELAAERALFEEEKKRNTEAAIKRQEEAAKVDQVFLQNQKLLEKLQQSQKEMEQLQQQLLQVQHLDIYEASKKIVTLKNKKNDLKNALGLVTFCLLPASPRFG